MCGLLAQRCCCSCALRRALLRPTCLQASRKDAAVKEAYNSYPDKRMHHLLADLASSGLLRVAAAGGEPTEVLLRADKLAQLHFRAGSGLGGGRDERDERPPSRRGYDQQQLQQQPQQQLQPRRLAPVLVDCALNEWELTMAGGWDGTVCAPAASAQHAQHASQQPWQIAYAQRVPPLDSWPAEVTVTGVPPWPEARQLAALEERCADAGLPGELPGIGSGWHIVRHTQLGAPRRAAPRGRALECSCAAHLHSRPLQWWLLRWGGRTAPGAGCATSQLRMRSKRRQPLTAYSSTRWVWHLGLAAWGRCGYSQHAACRCRPRYHGWSPCTAVALLPRPRRLRQDGICVSGRCPKRLACWLSATQKQRRPLKGSSQRLQRASSCRAARRHRCRSRAAARPAAAAAAHAAAAGGGAATAAGSAAPGRLVTTACQLQRGSRPPWHLTSFAPGRAMWQSGDSLAARWQSQASPNPGVAITVGHERWCRAQAHEVGGGVRMAGHLCCGCCACWLHCCGLWWNVLLNCHACQPVRHARSCCTPCCSRLAGSAEGRWARRHGQSEVCHRRTGG